MHSLSPSCGATCPQGWVTGPEQNYCYYVNNQKTVSWDNANKECALLNSQLVRMESQGQWDFVTNTISPTPSRNGYWTALNDLDPSANGLKDAGTGVFLWGNNEYPPSDVLKYKWNTEPDNNDNEDCVAMNLQATLSDEHCNSKLGYICEVLAPGGCLFGWENYNDKCYFISNFTKPGGVVNWNQAVANCASMDTGPNNPQGHILTLDTMDDETYMAYNIPRYWTFATTDKYWIGLTDSAKEGTYVYVNGDKYNKTIVQWTREPNNILGMEHCCVMLQSGDVSDRNCKDANNFICRKELSNSVAMNFGCGDWERAGTKCYQMNHNPVQDWATAQSMCQTSGGQLMKIENADEMTWLLDESLTSKMSFGGYWIGLNDKRTMDHINWDWADGTSADMSYLKWNHEPDNFNGNENCAAIGWDGVFYDFGCNSFKNGYVCEKPMDGGSCPSDWTQFGQGCYLMVPEYWTWTEASHKCNTRSLDGTGTLITFNNKPEMDFVWKLLVSKVGVPPFYWTSLTDRTTEGVWLYPNNKDNTPDAMSLVQWGSEPNNWHNNEHCVNVFYGGHLNDENCATTSGYICEKYPAGIHYNSASQSRSHTSTIGLVISVAMYISSL